MNITHYGIAVKQGLGISITFYADTLDELMVKVESYMDRGYTVTLKPMEKTK